jgi:hypothetical protein
MEETLTLTRLGIGGALKQTLKSTNPCESMIECVRRSARNVKRWQSGDRALRWTAAGILEAERQFRRIIGYRDLAKLATAVEREIAQTATNIPDRGGRYARHRLTVTSGPPSRTPRRAGHPPSSTWLRQACLSPCLVRLRRHGQRSGEVARNAPASRARLRLVALPPLATAALHPLQTLQSARYRCCNLPVGAATFYPLWLLQIVH